MLPEARAKSPAIPKPPTGSGRIKGKPAESLHGANLWDFMTITKALADENRVRMLLALRRQELCLCQLMELVKLAPSTASKHMSILRQARLVVGRKEGRWMYYRLPGRESSPVVRQALKWVQESLADDDQVLRDANRLQELLVLGDARLCEPDSTAQAGRGPRAKYGCRSC